MERGETRQITAILKQYKVGTEINYPVLFNIPTSERLPALISKDFLQATALVVCAVTLAFEKLNFKKKVAEVAVLINNIADEVIDTASDDNLSMEDLMIFLQGVVRGKYIQAVELSVPKFMNAFTQYREERWQAAIDLRDKKEQEFKELGDDNWFERNNRVSSIDQELVDYRKKIQDRKDEAALLKKENEILKQQRDF